MKDKAVIMINAEELLEWLITRREVIREKRDEATHEILQALYEGGVSELWEVTNYVKHMNYRVNKPADTEEE